MTYQLKYQTLLLHVIDCNQDEIRIFELYHNEWNNVFM